MATRGRTRYRNPSMTLPASLIFPDACMAWDKGTWPDRVASQRGFKDVHLDVFVPPSQGLAPCTYITIITHALWHISFPNRS